MKFFRCLFSRGLMSASELRVRLDQIHQSLHLAILNLGNRIMATQAEVAQALTDLGTQLDKVATEITAEVAKLEAAIAAGGASTPEVDAALAAVKAKVQTLDDLNPDATV